MPEVVTMKVRRPRAAAAVEAAVVPEPKAKATKSKANGKAGKAVASDRVSRFVGTTTGLSVKEYQNQTLAKNFKAKLTDEALAAAWRAEFPNAVAYNTEHVAGVRNAWNKAAHGNEAPAKPLHGYAEDGTDLPLWGDKSKQVKEKKAAAAASAAAEATAAKAAKKLGKTVKIAK